MHPCSKCRRPAIVSALTVRGERRYCAQCLDPILRQVAARRKARARWANTQDLNANRELYALRGELVFAQRYGFPINLTSPDRGDEGCDFRTPAGIVDVKAAKARELMIPEAIALDRRKTDIWVLIDPDQRFPMTGWCRRPAVLAAPIRMVKVMTRCVSDLDTIGALDRLLPGVPLTPDDLQWSVRV